MATAVLALVGALSACDPCAGTPSCHRLPELSYGGQFIERKTGKPVAGVHVSFIRRFGAEMSTTEIEATSDADGFFRLHAPVLGSGNNGTIGDFIVTPPAPHRTYRIRNFLITASVTRGEGMFGGRLVVDPYSFYMGEIIDRRTKARVPNAEVTLRLLGGVATAPDSLSFVTDGLGRFIIEPTLSGFGTYEYELTLRAPGDPVVYRFPLEIRTDYLDRDPYPTLIRFPRILQYSAEVSRRGTGEFLPGVTVTFVRTGGVQVRPATLSGPLVGSRFTIAPEPLDDGEVIGDLTISPPAPFLVEVIRGLRLKTFYRDTLVLLGPYGYGPQVFLQAHLVHRATGAPLSAGVTGRIKRVGGLPFVYPPGANPAADSGFRIVDSLGHLPFVAATADTGQVTLDVQVRLPSWAFENFNGITARAKNDSAPTIVGPLRVGGWSPWYGEARDMDTDAPIPGVSVMFQPSGTSRRVERFETASGADGRFRLAPVPKGPQDVTGTLRLRVPGGEYRDIVVPVVRLRITQDDTLRLLQVFRFRKTP